jgi:hypothetical protein
MASVATVVTVIVTVELISFKHFLCMSSHKLFHIAGIGRNSTTFVEAIMTIEIINKQISMPHQAALTSFVAC